MMRLAGQAQHRRSRLNSNVRRHMHRHAPVRTFLTAVAASLLGSYALAAEEPKDWKTVGLPGSVLILQSQSKVEEIRFVGEGWAVVTVGAKGGPLTGPIFPWSIERDRLKIGKDGEYDQLQLVTSSGGRLKAKRRSGEAVEYQLLKP